MTSLPTSASALLDALEERRRQSPRMGSVGGSSAAGEHLARGGGGSFRAAPSSPLAVRARGAGEEDADGEGEDDVYAGLDRSQIVALLEARDEDLQLAADLGRQLLHSNSELEARVEEAEEGLAAARRETAELDEAHGALRERLREEQVRGALCDAAGGIAAYGYSRLR